jgi:MbtH protein
MAGAADGEAPGEMVYEVVRNIEEQYSILPRGNAVPAGWSLVGKAGPQDECLRYIEEVWTDMTPLSVRRRMQAEAGEPLPSVS